MNIKDVMVKEIITVNPTAKIREAVELMNKKSNWLPSCDEKKQACRDND